MTTTTDAKHTAYPPFRPFLAHVADITPLSAHFTRITFDGPDLEHVRRTGYDQRIKLVLPLADDPLWEHSPLLAADCVERGAWWDVWRSLPADRRNVIRTYTLRTTPDDGRVCIEFVTHEGAGPAGTFAMTARPGDTVVLVAPDDRAETYGGGIDFHPGVAGNVLLVGDETATPAILGIIGSLAGTPWDGSITALLEVPESGDVIAAPECERLDIKWLPRNGSARGTRLVRAVEAYADAHPRSFVTRWRRTGDSPAPAYTETDVDRELLWETTGDGLPRIGSTSRLATGSDGFYAWVAGEAAVVRDVRRVLLRDHGLDRRRAAFMGYWRVGKSEI